MKGARLAIGTVGVAALIVLAGCGSSSGGSKSDASSSGGSKTLTVWYMDGSLSDKDAATLKSEFEAAHKGVTINYQVQKWDGIGEKLTTGLASNTPPDVVELGNTQVTTYAANGALADLTKSVKSFDNSSNWLKGLAEPGKWDNKQYAIPFYAGTRTVVYRKDMFEQAGVQVPTSWDDLLALGPKLNAKFGSDPNFMAMYLPGQEWYTAASLIWDEGGDLATGSGKNWKGALTTPQAEAGIARYKALYDALSKAPKDTDEANPQQYQVMAKGDVAMMIGLGWEAGSVATTNKDLADKLGTFALPSKTAGKLAPPMVGGSDLAVAAGSKNKDLATDFIKLVGSTKTQTALTEGGYIPNASTPALLDAAKNSSSPTLATAIAAAAAGKVTPVAPNWANVETSPNPLKDMLTQVLNGTPVDQAAQTANNQVTQRLAG
jgi:N,N'-diacetylchitobiose transport system substrate-binding protein